MPETQLPAASPEIQILLSPPRIDLQVVAPVTNLTEIPEWMSRINHNLSPAIRVRHIAFACGRGEADETLATLPSQ